MNLGVHICGVSAGVLYVDRYGKASFQYDGGYAGPDLSVSMPFARGTYPDDVVRPWFSGLLPDDVRVRLGMAAKAGTSSDVFSLLARYGLDMPGAVQVSTDANRGLIGAPGVYEQVEEAFIGSRLARLQREDSEGGEYSWLESNERWSLGGQQVKLALYEKGRDFYECHGSAASNIIVKPGIGRFRNQALDECVCMNLARLCGLPAAEVRMRRFGGVDALVVRRYDRVDDGEGGVMRLHQEDVCQALSCDPDSKYAADGGPSASDVVTLLGHAREGSIARFVDALLFNALIAATDAHAKNYSLLHVGRGDFTLAPLYDVASALPYMKPHKTYRLAMSIGGENRVGRLRRSRLEKFARLNGLAERVLAERAIELSELVRNNLDAALDTCSHVQGIDELADALVPRITSLCEAAKRGIRE